MEKRILISLMAILAMALPTTVFADIAPIPPAGGVSKGAIIGIIAVVVIAIIIIVAVFKKKK